MAQATFVHASQTVTFTRAPLRPPRSLERIQSREETAVSVPIVYASLAVNDLLGLSLRLTDAEREQLQFFWNNTARGASNAFTYNDVAGVALSVKFHQASLAFHEVAYNHHQTTVLLRVQ